MRLHGHLVEIDWNGSLLAARPTNSDGRALVNVSPDLARLELTPADIADVVFRDAPKHVGGVVIVVDAAGGEHRLHFRRDTREDFYRFSVELGEAVARAHEQHPLVVDLTEAGVDAEERGSDAERRAPDADARPATDDLPGRRPVRATPSTPQRGLEPSY